MSIKQLFLVLSAIAILNSCSAGAKNIEKTDLDHRVKNSSSFYTETEIKNKQIKQELRKYSVDFKTYSEITNDNVVIRGHDNFKELIKLAMDYYKEKLPEEYEKTMKHVKLIELKTNDNLPVLKNIYKYCFIPSYDEKYGLCTIKAGSGVNYKNCSLTSAIALIACEAYRIKENKNPNSKYNKLSWIEKEHAGFDEAIRILELLNGPKIEISTLKSLKILQSRKDRLNYLKEYNQKRDKK